MGLVYHDRKVLEADIKALSDRQLEDGILIDCPKARRRAQAMDEARPARLVIPLDIKKRFLTQVNRWVEQHGKDLGWVKLCRRLERPFTEEELSENDFDDSQTEAQEERCNEVR